LIRRRRREEVDGERRQPVFTGVVAAGDVAERRFRVTACRLGENLSGVVVLGKRRRDAAHAPGPAQVEAVEVNELWIGAVRHFGRFQKAFRRNKVLYAAGMAIANAL